MTRVKIWLGSIGAGTGKVLRYDPNQTDGLLPALPLDTLKHLMANKLGWKCDDRVLEKANIFLVTSNSTSGVLIEDAGEIEDGDELVLKHDVKREQGDDQQVKQEKESREKNAKVKTEASLEAENSDDGSVQDVTEEMRQKREGTFKPKIIELFDESSCDDDDDDDDDAESDKEIQGEVSTEEDDDDEDGPSSEQCDEDEDDEDYLVRKPAAQPTQLSRKRKAGPAKPPAESRLEVLIDEKDVPTAPGKREVLDAMETQDVNECSTLAGSAEQKVKDRIIKLLNTGFHEQSNENEAQNAMKLAQRLMRKHNLSQALLLQERDASASKEEQVLRGGLVEVRIVNRKTRRPAILERWILDLTGPVCENFLVESYNTVQSRKCCSVTFYGIYTNAQLAAYAFKIATERITQMMADYRPDKRRNWFFREVSTKSARLSYALGIVRGIEDAVEADMERERVERLQKLERARRAASTGEAYEESENEEEEAASGDDEDKEGRGNSFPRVSVETSDRASMSEAPGSGAQPSFSPNPSARATTPASASFPHSGTTNSGEGTTHRTTLTGEALERRLEEMEKEEQAALVLVDHKEKIAEQVLKDEGIELSAGRKLKPIQFDSNSYRRGVEDSREIDINQRAIRDEVRIKKERK